ncbi:unnamed protein product [Larinioides sclopetarius]|uniref:Uncharacterized protein n=1 Tax=Larinioides sclopetarius TaxID=280406 RepID=A0AAV2AHX7_9ARAC
MTAIPDCLEFKDVEFDDDRLDSIKIYQNKLQGRKNQSLSEFKSLLTGKENCFVRV